MKKKWYKGKVFVLTGAGGEIGRAVCRRFAPLGAKFYLIDLADKIPEEFLKELKDLGAEFVEYFVCNVTDKENISKVIKTIGEKENYIDILFNNAGIGSRCSILNDCSVEEYRKVMSINVDAMWAILQETKPYIGRPSPTKKNPQRKLGQLIFSSSAAGITGVPFMAAYAMSKAAIIALADSVRLEYKLLKMDIQVICGVSAPATTQFYNTPDLENWIESYKNQGGLYKTLSADDVAKRILKGSLKYRRKVYVPRWWWLLEFLYVISNKFIGNMLMKIEKKKE